MRSRNLIQYIELVLVIGLLAFVYFSNLSDVEFHGDESQWIGTSDAFESYLRMEFDSPVWAPSYWTLTQPPVARYVIGAGRYTGGYRRPDLNRPWDFERGRNFNERRGAMPSDGLLWWSRLPMAVLGIASIIIMFMLLRKSSGVLTSYFWLGFVAANPYFTLHLRRAMGESCLVFFSILALYLSTRALQLTKDTNIAGRRNAFIWLALGGVAGGLAWASKLNGISIVMANIIVAIILGIKMNNGLKDKVIYSLWYSLVTGVASLFIFLAVNPFLWESPARRVFQMFENRTQEMSEQADSYAGSYMDINARIRIIPTRVFKDYASLPLPGAFNFVLTLLGILISSNSLLEMLVNRDFRPAHVSLLITSFFTAMPIWLSQLDWDRYYIFPVWFSTAFIAIASGWTVNLLFRTCRQSSLE
jgi:4-amino-4-deoxy-L-arabinose transferase-like glycosyltransferase